MKAISYPFTIDTHGSVAWTTDPRKVWQDRVRAVLNTAVGDRAMRPLFGLNSANTLMNLGTPAATPIQEAVQTAFSSWLPTVTLNSVETEFDNDSGVLLVQVWFTIPDGSVTSTAVSFNSGLVTDETTFEVAT